MIIPSLTRQNFCLHQGSNTLFKEKRVPLCPFDQKLLERLKPVVIPQNRIENLPRALGRQRIKPELGVISLVGPTMLVFWSIIDQEEEPARRQTFHQALQHRL